MSILILFLMTTFISMLCGAVMLIQIGGWFPILVAILLIVQWSVLIGLILMIAFEAMNKKEKENKA